MSNISRKHREQLVSKIFGLKRYLKENSASEHFLQLLDDIKQELVQEKNGLVFENHIEDADYMDNDKAILIEQNDLRIENGGHINQLIEGENLIVLKLLKQNHRRGVDVICIDPPYNTGMSWLNYNDHEYVNEDDSYRHSKWLSFMKKRLDIAYELLSDAGVMFINIDENETGTLLLLCQQLFGENNVEVLIWPKTDPRFDKNRVEKPFRDIKVIHEYVFLCFKNREQTRLNKIFLPVLANGKWTDYSTNMESILRGMGTTSSAKDELAEVFGDRYRFQTPKPMRLIKEFVRTASKPDSVILDFFAGSGTTGHAVMDMNKEDGGRRRFILVNNNENNICRKVAYKRLQWAIENYKYSESLKYFKIAYKETGFPLPTFQYTR